MSGFSHNQYADGATHERAIERAIQRHFADMGSCTLVQVQAVHSGNGITGTVDVLPLTHQQDSSGDTVPHTTIYGVPYLRIQGGANALIIDPAANDIGYIIISGRDQTNVVANRAPAAPGSFRMHSMSDCVYVGGFINTDPAQYVRVAGNGITLCADTVTATNNLTVGAGATGSFTTPAGLTVTVRSGIITNIA